MFSEHTLLQVEQMTDAITSVLKELQRLDRTKEQVLQRCVSERLSASLAAYEHDLKLSEENLARKESRRMLRHLLRERNNG